MTEEKEDIYSLSFIEKKLNKINLEYFRFYEKAQKKFEKFAILLQVGSFYEIYGYEMKDFKLGNIRDLQKILNCHVTRKNGTKPHNYSNPLMAGFPEYTINKYINILKQHQYVIYLINQKDNCKCKKIKKECKCKKSRDDAIIISPGSDTNHITEDNNFLCSIYLEQYSIRNKYIKVAGVSFIDISTGESYINQFADNNEDFDYAFNQIIKTISAINPSEIIIYNKNLNMTKDEIIKNLEIGDIFTRYFDNLDKQYFNIEYQKNYFMKIFKTKIGMMDVIDYLGIGINMESRNSFMVMLHIIENYQPQLINNIEKPILDFNQKSMILDNTTIKQLDIFKKIQDNTKNKYTSIFNVINYTRSNIGYRYLKHRITNPELNCDVINFRYNLTNELLENNMYKNLDEILKKIPDFERLHRKINLQTITLNDFCILNDGYKNILNLYFDKNMKIYNNFLNNTLLKNDLENYINTYKKIFKISSMNNNANKSKKTSSYYRTNNIFKMGIYKD